MIYKGGIKCNNGKRVYNQNYININKCQAKNLRAYNRAN